MYLEKNKQTTGYRLHLGASGQKRGYVGDKNIALVILIFGDYISGYYYNLHEKYGSQRIIIIIINILKS